MEYSWDLKPEDLGSGPNLAFSVSITIRLFKPLFSHISEISPYLNYLPGLLGSSDEEMSLKHTYYGYTQV